MTKGHNEAEGYAASLRQMAQWVDEANESPGQYNNIGLEDIDTEELRAAAAFIDRFTSPAATPPSVADRLNRECLETLNATDDGDPAGNLLTVLKKGFTALGWAQPSLAADELITAILAITPAPSFDTTATRPSAAIENLTHHQVQCDMDGVMIQVSRQALDEVLNYLSVTRPDHRAPSEGK